MKAPVTDVLAFTLEDRGLTVAGVADDSAALVALNSPLTTVKDRPDWILTVEAFSLVAACRNHAQSTCTSLNMIAGCPVLARTDLQNMPYGGTRLLPSTTSSNAARSW
jgi:hypothetical protein